MIETGDGTLKIPDLSVEDQDIYICRASNSAGVISNEISLRIRRGPKFVIKPQNKTVKIGEEVQFEWWVSEILIGSDSGPSELNDRMAAQIGCKPSQNRNFWKTVMKRILKLF